MKISLLGVWFALLVTLSTAHATEDPLRDTLWIRQMPLGGQNFSKPLFHPNGKTVFATSDQYMFEYDVATGELLKTRETKSQLHINDYVLTSDVQYIIVGTLKENAAKQGIVEVWHIDTGFVKSFTLQKYQYVEKLAVTSDNKTLFVGSAPYGLYRINLESMQVEKENPNFGDQIALSPDGKTLISTVEYFQGGDETVSFLLDSENFKIIGSVPDYLYAPTFNATGDYIVGGTYYQKKDYLALYDLRTGEYHRMGVNSTVFDTKFTKDNKYFIATTSSSGYLVYNVEEKKRLYSAPYETGGDFIALSPDNKLYCAVNPAFHVRMWNFTNPIINGFYDENSSLFSIYPNPTQSSIKIQFPRSESHGECTMYDIQGNIILHAMIPSHALQEGHYSFSIEHIPNGSFTCNVKIGNSQFSTSCIINR